MSIAALWWGALTFILFVIQKVLREGETSKSLKCIVFAIWKHLVSVFAHDKYLCFNFKNILLKILSQYFIDVFWLHSIFQDTKICTDNQSSIWLLHHSDGSCNFYPFSTYFQTYSFSSLPFPCCHDGFVERDRWIFEKHLFASIDVWCLVN